jgi:glyoxylate/hydroxypyruvate reductase A
MAETALWAVLSLQRGFFDYALQQRAGDWQQRAQRRAQDVGVLVLGLGQMGSAVAGGWLRRAIGSVRGMRRPAGVSAAAGGRGGGGSQALEALLPAAQIVVNLLPLTPSTQGLLDARFFAALPAGASIVNLARGAHLVDEDVLAALDSGHLDRAGARCLPDRTAARRAPYWQHPRVTLLPHVAARHRRTQRCRRGGGQSAGPCATVRR